MNGCAGRVSGFGHIETVLTKLSGQRAYSLLKCRGGEFFYREVDIQEILENGLIKRK